MGRPLSGRAWRLVAGFLAQHAAISMKRTTGYAVLRL
jgi:hypothetical protein